MRWTTPGFLILISGLFLLAYSGCGKQPDTIEAENLRTLIENGEAVVLDVRTESELTGSLGTLEGILHIPLQKLPDRYAELDSLRNKSIYVICRSGNRSGKAASFLSDKGYRAVNVVGGMRAWRAAFGDADR